MPQLDRVIIFPQIFWFFLVFIIFYIILVHLFLPKFLFSLRLRKYIIDLNDVTFKNFESYDKELKFKFLHTLVDNLSKLKSSINLNSNNLNLIFQKSKFINPSSSNYVLVKFLKNNLLFCNIKLLNLIILYPSNLNLK